jgi:ADP-heptose:LPS heptosyltransferase
MSIKMSRFLQKIALTYWRTKSAKLKAEVFSLPETLTDPRTIVILMPSDSKEFEMANEALKQLETGFPRTKIFVCLNEIFRTWIPHALISRSIIVEEADFNTLSLPKASLLQKIQTLNCEVAIDMNSHFNLGYAAVCAQSGARIRISFDKPNSHLFYNFVIRSEDASKLPRRYDALVKYLTSFGAPIPETSEIL